MKMMENNRNGEESVTNGLSTANLVMHPKFLPNIEEPRNNPISLLASKTHSFAGYIP
jgi:hypothetical protein